MTADDLGALAHAGQAEVSGPRFLEHRQIDAAAVIAYPESELFRVEADLHLDPARARMPEGVAHAFGGNPVDVVPHEGIEVPRLTGDGDLDGRMTASRVV